MSQITTSNTLRRSTSVGNDKRDTPKVHASGCTNRIKRKLDDHITP